MKLQKALGSAELLLAAIIWGFAFVAQTAGASTIPTFTFNCVRSCIASIFLAILLFVVFRASKKRGTPIFLGKYKDIILGGICCGIALFVATNIQQYGISLYPSGAGASGRSGFITALYVVLVPCFSIFFRRRIHPLVWVGVLVAVAGMYMLCVSGGINSIYKGDIVVFFCALAFCGHILVVDRFVSKANGIALSCIQFLTVGVLSLICMLLFESPRPSELFDAAFPLLYLGIMSSGVGYTLQIVGQKNTEPTVASILMSLESVFAVIGGWLLLGERLSARELTGCALVFLAILIAQAPGFIRKKDLTEEID